MSCEARQYSDQMYCKACNLTWDMNDMDPPGCMPLPRTAFRELQGHTDTRLLFTLVYYKGAVALVWGRKHHKRASNMLIAMRERDE